MTSQRDGSAVAKLFLRPWHIVSQMVTWAPTPQYAVDRGMECGEACIVMVLKHCSGVWTSAAYLDYMLQGMPGRMQQGTTVDQMVSLFSQHETSCEVLQPADLKGYWEAVKSAIGKGHPLIPLRYWDHPGNSLLHYAVVIGYDEEAKTFRVAGPGHGVIYDEDEQTHWAMYAGYLIHVQRKRMLGNH